LDELEGHRQPVRLAVLPTARLLVLGVLMCDTTTILTDQ